MADDNQLPEFPEGSPGQKTEGGSSRGRRRNVRRTGMPEEERRARQQRRRQFRARFRAANEDKRREETEDGKPDIDDSNATQAAIEQESADDPILAEAEGIQERKPWETLVIGSLGENLSYIEEKNREIERQQYIVRYHQEHSPHEVAHNQEILDELIQERSEMEDDEENNMPQDKREEKKRIGERLDSLNWALDTCQCEDEEINIRAAIQGYQSGEILYSNNFTLIYGGHIVDVCPSYQSFCVDRQERLDRYFAKYGPGWLWQEPPLAGPGFEAMANKALCLNQDGNKNNYFFGSYTVNMRFAVDRRQVMRKTPRGFIRDRSWRQPNSEISCCFETLLDSGATLPNLSLVDLRHLNVDLKYYAAQGVTKIRTVSDIQERRLFEMRVSVCSKDGTSLVGEGDQAVWPSERRMIGGFVPVWINEDAEGPSSFKDRLSGMIPFESCYVGSAPTTKEMWLGEDRRDVLGARRMPSLLRYDTEKQVGLTYPAHFQRLRAEAKTPDQVVFIHKLDPAKGKGSTFIDADWPGVRGKTELAILHREFDKARQRIITKSQEKVVLEPRTGERWEAAKEKPIWREEFLGPRDFAKPDYTGVGEKRLSGRRFGRR
ncbi:uncharacterized protein F4817DRAFT_273983 [Daldinia loculata]|uniref:uncharacterized protein n=1 Tax=Daldinia loculata TaxID=103429 RepID=UPI0020C5269D|nr:uncharacterized protein F4817DRAFT_273983 [Daldinia loculata]KAI1642985.1 hypothetical protein F4817DRAFT_273983 [Daldinia loculata]